MQKLLKNSTRKTAAHAMRSIASAVPSRPSSFALIVALALLAASCKTTRTMQSSHRRTEELRSDSSASRSLQEATSHVKTTAMWTRPVSADTSHLEIPLDKLTQLPEGASFTGKKGRANVKVSFSQGRENGKPSVLIESSCDSLSDLCYWYSEQNDSLMKQIDLLEKMKQHALLDDEQQAKERQNKLAELKGFGKLVGAVMLVLFLLSLIDHIFYKRKNKKE